jgi:APA family basic amino acid/polyamine antiporter
MPDSSKVERQHRVGLIALTAIAVNGIVGTSIFVLPAAVANITGQASVFPYLMALLATLLIGLCFAQLSSLFECSGGPYVYAREAFGSLIGFEVGWLFILARVTAVAAVVNVLVSYLGYFLPAAASGPGRFIVITIVLVALCGANFFGLSYGVRTLNVLTVGKLFPLLLFVSVGLFMVHGSMHYFLAVPSGANLQKASLLLIFGFTGFEYASVPSEEVIASKRNTPIAIVLAICFTGILYTLIQIVSVGTLPTLSTDATPLASAARHFLGPAGGAILTSGAVLSAAGTISAATLVGPRMIHALARGGQLPELLGRIHQRYQTPHVSIALFSILVWILALFNDFAGLAALSSVVRLFYYITTCLAVPILRVRMQHPRREVSFMTFGIALVPILAVAICVWLLSSVTRSEAIIGACSLLLGGIVYGSYKEYRSRLLPG